MQGPVEAGVLRQALALKAPIPKKFAEAPELPLGTELYLEAFWDLDSCRGVGLGLTAIPWSAVMDYAQAYELDAEQTEDLVYFVRVLDTAYLQHQRSRQGK